MTLRRFSEDLKRWHARGLELLDGPGRSSKSFHHLYVELEIAYRRFAHRFGGAGVFVARERRTRTELKRLKRRARRRGIRNGTFVDTTMKRKPWTRTKRARFQRRLDVRYAAGAPRSLSDQGVS